MYPHCRRGRQVFGKSDGLDGARLGHCKAPLLPQRFFLLLCALQFLSGCARMTYGPGLGLGLAFCGLFPLAPSSRGGQLVFTCLGVRSERRPKKRGSYNRKGDQM